MHKDGQADHKADTPAINDIDVFKESLDDIVENPIIENPTGPK